MDLLQVIWDQVDGPMGPPPGDMGPRWRTSRPRGPPPGDMAGPGPDGPMGPPPGEPGDLLQVTNGTTSRDRGTSSRTMGPMDLLQGHGTRDLGPMGPPPGDMDQWLQDQWDHLQVNGWTGSIIW